MTEKITTVTVTTKNTPAMTMGIIATVLGVLAMLVGWIPFVGLFAIPVAAIGTLLAFIGLILALIKKFQGITMPLIGGMICFTAIIISISSTGATSLAISESIEESKARTEEENLQETTQE